MKGDWYEIIPIETSLECRPMSCSAGNTKLVYLTRPCPELYLSWCGFAAGVRGLALLTR